MLNGAPTDPNAAQFKKGAHSVLDRVTLKILGAGSSTTPTGAPTTPRSS